MAQEKNIPAKEGRQCGTRKSLFLSLIVLCLVSTVLHIKLSPKYEHACDCRPTSRTSNDTRCEDICRQVIEFPAGIIRGRDTFQANKTGAHRTVRLAAIPFSTPVVVASTATNNSIQTSTTIATTSLKTTTVSTSPHTNITRLSTTIPSESGVITTVTTAIANATTITTTIIMDKTGITVIVTTKSTAAHASTDSATTTNTFHTETNTKTDATKIVAVNNAIGHKVPEKILNIGNCYDCLKGKVLVAVKKGWLCGDTRLGNKMSMIAAARAAAAKHNAIYVTNQDDGHCKALGQLQKLFIEVKDTTPMLPYSMMNNWTDISEAGFTKFSPIKVQRVNMTVSGYRQSWKYFSSGIEEQAVRQTFRFTLLYETISNMFIQKAKSNFTSVSEPIFIGVHMRLGDLFTKQFMTYGYRAANTSFYSTAMKKATSHFNNSKSIIFLVATDSPKVAKGMLKGLEKVYNIYWIGGTANEDFATLTKCNHSIISGGTFGFWAAWLAGGKTFYFSEFGKPGTDFHKGFYKENFYLPSWIPVGWS